MKTELIIALAFVGAGLSLMAVGATLLFGPVALLVAGLVLLAVGALVPWERLT